MNSVPYAGESGQWDPEGEIHNLPVMVSLREELRMLMWSIHTRYDCARKVLMNHLDLQKLPERQAKGGLQKIWSDWTFSKKKTRKDAYKAIPRENARHIFFVKGALFRGKGGPPVLE